MSTKWGGQTKQLSPPGEPLAGGSRVAASSSPGDGGTRRGRTYSGFLSHEPYCRVCNCQWGVDLLGTFLVLERDALGTAARRRSSSVVCCPLAVICQPSDNCGLFSMRGGRPLVIDCQTGDGLRLTVVAGVSPDIWNSVRSVPRPRGSPVRRGGLGRRRCGWNL